MGAVAGGTIARILEPVWHPIDSWVSAQFAPFDYLNKISSWRDNPCQIPGVDPLMEIWARGLADDRLIRGALKLNGVDMRPGQQHATTGQTRNLWLAARKLKQAVPDPGMVIDAWQRGLIATEDVGRRLMRRAGGDWDRLMTISNTLLTRPGPEMVVAAWAEGRIEWTEAEPYIKLFRGSVDSWKAVRDWHYTAPSIGDAVQMLRRSPGFLDADFQQVLQRARINLPDWLPHYQALLKEIPGVADLVRFTARQLFRPELVGPYGLYDGFDERSRPWFAKLGLDYPLGFQIPVDGQFREATLPDLYWAASREILPLSLAYAAYQRLREDQVGRMQAEVPGLRPFTVDDLRFHLRVAGYPPPMQDFMIALSHQPLGQRQIQWGLQYVGKDRAWAFNRYLDMGLSQENAGTMADVAVQRESDRENAWLNALVTKAKRDTVTQIEGMYNDGILSRQQALSHLSDAGLSVNLSSQLLDLADSNRARGLLRAAVNALGRDYLSGALSADETVQALGDYGIQRQRAGELMQIWSIRRSRHRRQASTAQIIRWVGTGRISTADGARRLANLDWSNPDALLLLADAQASLDKLHAREAKLAEADLEKRARELERLAREARAEQKRLLAEANRIAPRTVLTKWLLDGVIGKDEWYQAMRDRNYPDNIIDDYYRDATTPKPPRPKVAPSVKQFPRPEGSVHPGLAVAKKWAKDGVIHKAQFEEMIHDLGYSDADTARFVEDQYPTQGS